MIAAPNDLDPLVFGVIAVSVLANRPQDGRLKIIVAMQPMKS
jgi:hypothetical protein